MTQLVTSADTAETLDQLQGTEGPASALYYQALRGFLHKGFHRRDRRNPDVANVLFNYCSALLRETVMSAIVECGLDPRVSFLHRPGRGRPTLAFDLMEECARFCSMPRS